jgi:iron complex outermembrane recepter protein
MPAALPPGAPPFITGTKDMTPKIRKLSLALAQVLGGGLAVTVAATAVHAQQPQRVEKIEVTGSNIKRVDTEGPAPVEIITKQQIERTGATNTNELLRSIATIDIFDQGETASNSPAGSGTATIRLRGFSESNTLVLLNGKRLPINALYDSSGAGAAVDINMIPISAIERVEILKDGGSAIYGADAVAGVVNFITKRDWTGAEVKVGYGKSSRGDAEEQSASAAAGFGNLDKNGYNVLVAVDRFKRDPILRKDRDISRSVDFRRFGAGDYRSSFSPFGNILDENFNFAGRTVRPCPPENQSGVICRYDFNASLLTGYNGADRWSGMIVGNLRLGSMKAYAQYTYSQSKDHFEAHPVPDFFLLPSGNYYAGRFLQGGPRITDRKGEVNHMVLGLQGAAGRWDWEINGGQGKSEVENRDKNYYNAELWFPALDAGLIDATVNTNNPAFVESLKVSPTRIGESTNTFAEAKVSGELMQMRNGPLALAFGVQGMREELVDTPDALTQQGLVVGSIQQSAVSAKRTVKSVYAEVSVPLLRNVELQGALRYDKYPNESNVSPKIAARWSVTPNFLVRASYTESFRAPSLKQLFGNPEQGADTIATPEECAAIQQPADCSVPAFFQTGGNVNLKAETGETYNLGFVFDQGPFSAGIDFWRLDKTDNITTPTVLSALQQGLTGRTSNGILVVFTNLQNFAQASSQGVDLDLRLRAGQTRFGRLTLGNSTTYYQWIRTRAVGESWGNFQGTYATPRVRNVFTATLEQGPWAGTAQWRTVGGFRDTDAGASGDEPIPATVRRVGTHEELDLQLSFSGIRNLRFDLGMKNALDRMPPFSITNASQNSYTQMGFAELYTNRGRFYYGTLTYTFR